MARTDDEYQREQERNRAAKAAEKLSELLRDVAAYTGHGKYEDLVICMAVSRMHRTEQQMLMNVLMRCVESWAANSGPGCHDLRNEATVALAVKIVNATDKYERRLPLI